MKTNQATLTSYVTGFILSVLFTLGAYVVVTNNIIASSWVVSAIIIMAIIQLVIQLFFFLHVGRETGPRWKLVTLISTTGVILILLLGSLWIMSHLNYRMTPAQMDRSVIKAEGMPGM